MVDNVLITGGAGFIGSNLANYFLGKGKDVTIYDNLLRRGVSKNIEWLRDLYGDIITIIEDDIRDYNTLKTTLKDVEAICHCAGQVAVTTSVENPREDFEINALGTFNVLEAARQSPNDPIVIFTSTNKVYGGMENIKVIEKDTRYEYKDLKYGAPESQSLDFHSPYGCSKGAGDQYVRDYYRIYGLKTVVFRMSCIYGPRQFGSVDQGWVAHFIISSILNNPLTIYGNGKQTRDVLYVDDLVRAFELGTEKIKTTKGEIYNLGGGKENTISLLEFIDLLEENLGREISLNFDNWRPGDQKVYYSDVRKAEKDFNWKPQVNSVEGVKRLFDWVWENQRLFD